MAVHSESIQVSTPATTSRAIGGLAYDWAMIVACIWFVGGLFIDGWAHNNGKVDTSFFTPYHAMFYSGFAVVAAVILGPLLRNVSQGMSWRRAIPAGYELAIVGVAVFSFGGVFDLIWHTLFGIEISYEALYSPSHLMLGLGLVLLVSSPLRAAWARRSTDETGWIRLLPMLVSLLFTLSIFTFFTQTTHPFVNLYAGSDWAQQTSNFTKELVQEGGVLSAMLQAALLMGFLLLAIRRWKLPPGSLTFIMTINVLFMTLLQNTEALVPGVLVAGIVADVLLILLKPSIARPIALRIFAFAVPVVLYSIYYFMVSANGGIWWSFHLWTGSIVLCGVSGLLLSYLVLPSPGASLPIQSQN